MFKTDNVMSVTNPPTKALIIDLFNFAGHMKSSTVKVHNEPVLHNLFTLANLKLNLHNCKELDTTHNKRRYKLYLHKNRQPLFRCSTAKLFILGARRVYKSM